ncbi:MAG: ABC transporter ATP-binding protein [Dehalococcoidia bacterium]|nr:ABC transporter ATP-binding protein [Dehalococcoidia bacterium]
MRGLRVAGLALTVPHRTLWSGVTLSLEPGESLAIMGPSGSGKTSLLHCLCGIRRPNGGTIILDGVEVTRLGASAMATLRRDRIGMVFQFGELLPELTVEENVQLPLRLAGLGRQEAARRASEALARAGLTDVGPGRTNVLSGGEVQRVAIARAIAKSPALLLADEPTGALDEANGMLVAQLLFGLAREVGAVVVVATHNPKVARLADRIGLLNNATLEIASGVTGGAA